MVRWDLSSFFFNVLEFHFSNLLFPDTSDENRCESAHLGFQGATFDLTSPVAFAADPPPRFRTRPKTIHHAQSKTHRIPYAVNSDFNHKPPYVTGRVVRGAVPEHAAACLSRVSRDHVSVATLIQIHL